MKALAPLPALLIATGAMAQPTPYRAGGTEPFWSLTIARQQTRLEEAGRQPLVVPTPIERRTRNGRRYVGRAIAIDITRTRCSDGMSDRRYPETVIVTVRGRSLRGCGGLPNATQTGGQRLAGTAWTILAIDGRSIGPRLRPAVEFTDNGIQGKVCNRFGADYRLERDRLTAGPIAATRMACVGPMQPVEAGFLKVMGAPVLVRWQGRDRLELSNRAGSVTLARTR